MDSEIAAFARTISSLGRDLGRRRKAISFAVARGEKWVVVAKQKGGPGRERTTGGGGYYHSGAEAYITRPPLSFLTGISAKLSPLLPRRESRGGDETRARVWHPAGARCEPPVASDGRKNDGHKYRSYLCFMTCSGSSWRRQNPEAKLQLSTGRILTDVLAQWIRHSFLSPPPANTVAALF